MKKLLLVCLVLMPIKSVYALTCTYITGREAINTTIQLQGANITVGPDMPDGTVLYRQYFKPSFQPAINCDGGHTFTVNDVIRLAPRPLSSWNGNPYPGQIYETGVPGIGFVAWYSGTPFPRLRTQGTAPGSVTRSFAPEFDISLVKIGPVTPGILLGSNLLTVGVDYNVQGVPTMPILTANFGGSINIVSRTCTTPSNINVQLGSHNINTEFKSVGSVTPWIDASIKFTDCPYFYGTKEDGRNFFYSNDGTQGTGASKANTITVSLTPSNPIINSTSGIMAVNSSTQMPAAQGVGIQLGSGNNTETPVPFNFGSTPRFTPANDGTPTFKIPLSARYYQTSATVQPGRADGRLTFTINYY
ncbi:fimbrial protein [Yersinia sp. 2540 StPb PI]|uniref:fimbrial protein n=1 Tax=Yersinia sp. 2540 StPb PI TaxID=3117406 RepID=UPI003FA486F9